MKFFHSPKHKGSHTLDLYLTQNNELPPIPFELKPFLSEDEWEERLLVLADIIKTSYRPVLERVYVAFAVTATVASPIILFSLLSNVSAARGVSYSGFVMDRFIGLAIILAIGVVLWAPFVIWRIMAARRLKRTLSTWEDLDRVRNQGITIPRLNVKPPSVFRTVTLIRIITLNRPASSQDSNFSTIPNFYFSNNPASAARAYFYPYVKREKGMPHMSVVGGGFDYRTSVFKRGASEYDPKSPSSYAKAGSTYGARSPSTVKRAFGSEYAFSTNRASTVDAKPEYRTSTFYQEYFEELDKGDGLKPPKPVRTPIRGTMAGGRAATPLAMAIIPKEPEIVDDRW